MKSLTRTAYRAIAAFVTAAFVMIGLASPAFADGTTGTITNQRTGIVYTDVAIATKEAASGDTLVLGEGNYTLYKVDSAGTTKGKNLTFVGQGTEKTAWNIGALVPDPANYGTEYNGDYSFDGAGTVTFKNMTLRSGSVDYLGFIRADKTVVDGCIVNGKTFYWGYTSAEFKGTTFNAPSGDYALWTYSSPTMTFDNCTFNASGKVINVYTDAGAGTHDITVNVSNCTFRSNSGWFSKQALNINDSNMGSYKYILNFTDTNEVTAERDNTTCSQLFGFGGKSSTNNKGKTDVTINGELAWTAGKMLTHDYTDGQHEDNFVDQNDYVWKKEDDGWYCTGHAKCGYCGWPIEETVKATYTDTTNCTEKGERVYTATFTHKCFKPQTKTEALDPIGHEWGAPEYSWSKQDGEWYCTAKRTCKRDVSHIEEETVKASVETTPATCLEAGKSVYTATFSNKAFETQKRTVALGVLGHDWAAPEYSWAKQDGEWFCTAKRACKRDASHIEDETVKVTVEHVIKSTCDVAGKDIYTATFSNKAFETQTKTVVLGILGHDWAAPEYTWNKQDGEWYCTAKRVCKRDASHVEEETEKATVEHVTKATCEAAGKDVYTVTFKNKAFETQTRTVALGVLGHDWADPEYSWNEKDGNWFCTAKRVCKRDASHIEEETVEATVETTPATCTEAGKSVYTASFKSDTFKTQAKTEKLNPLDHDWSKAEYTWSQKDGEWFCTAKRICKRDASHVDEQTVKATAETTPATCTDKGESVYTAKFDGDVFKTQTKTETLDALNHDWGKPEYVWSQKDGEWYCAAKRVCKRDASHVEKETVKAAYEVTTPATTEKEGEGTYTATFENEAFETQTKTESIDKLPVKPQEPAKPKDDKPGKTDKTDKQALPGTGDSTATAIISMLAMASICFAASAVISRVRK